MQRYLVIQLARFGDILQTKRLLQSLAAQPGAEVHLAVDQSLAALAKLIYPKVSVHGVPMHGPTPNRARLLEQCRPLFRKWREAGYERVFNLNHSGFNHVLAGLFDPGQVAGYQWRGGQVLRGLWPDMAFRLTRCRLTNPLNLMDYWGYFFAPALEPAMVNPPARPRGGGLGVVLAGRHARRSLPVSALAQALTAIARVHEGPVHLLGTDAERPAARKLRGLLGAPLQSRLRDLTGRTGWSDLVEVTGQLDALISPDTGTMHLAAHLGVPVTAFFLSSAWCYETGPYGAGHLVLQATRPCAPCLESQPCPEDASCLTPFTHKAALAALAGVRSGSLSDLCILQSFVDDFGLGFRPLTGKMPQETERQSLRALLRSHCLGHIPAGVRAESVPAAILYDESHWMVEQS